MPPNFTGAQRAAIASYIEHRRVPTEGESWCDARLIVDAYADPPERMSQAIIDARAHPALECVSPVIGAWIAPVHNALPLDISRGAWRWLVPLAVRAGRDPEHERQRLALIMDWVWGTVLPALQPLADSLRPLGGRPGFANEWRAMITERSVDAAVAASVAATSASFALDVPGDEAAAAAAGVAKEAARAAHAVQTVGAEAAAAYAARTAAPAARAADAGASAAVRAPIPLTRPPPGPAAAATWVALDPPMLLARLLAVG